jgi:hypothetical protein
LSAAVEERPSPQPPERLTRIEPELQRRMDRGRSRMRQRAPQRRLNYKFWQGDTYWYVNGKGLLVNQGTVSWLLGGDKPNHRIRNKYPFIAMIVAAKVSAATQRVPGYEISPSTSEPDDYAAAQLAQKVALWGYDKWHLRRITTQAFTHALVGGEGFVYPYWDANVGPYIDEINPQTGEMETLAQGEIAHKVLSPNEVYWEPGVDFDNARWYCIEQARTLDEVKAMPGFLGGELAADATDSDAPSDADTTNLVLVTEYFERPSPEYKNGRWIVMANRRRVVRDRDYPCLDHEGKVLDEPLLVRISWTVEVDDRDRSLVEMLIDLQRTINDCWNKLLEWKNRCLNPQMLAPRGSSVSRGTDEPGIIRYYNPTGAQPPKWETPPAVPRELFTILDKAIEHLRAISADVDVQPDPRLTAQTAQSAIEQAQLRWQSFLGDAAEFHSRLMRRNLYLVQRHYTEQRDLKLSGTWDTPDIINGFLGANLLGQADVRVSPASLANQSAQKVASDAMTFAQNQWISPQTAMMAITTGRSEVITQSWQKDAERAAYIVQTIKRGPDALFQIPDRPVFPGEQPPTNPLTGEPLLVGPDGQAKVPGYMPRPFDKEEVQMEFFENWMKTTDWDRLDPAMQHAALIYYQALLDQKQRKAMQAAMQQQQMAEGLGLANAAKTPGAPMLPSTRAPENQGPQGASGGPDAG